MTTQSGSLQSYLYFLNENGIANIAKSIACVAVVPICTMVAENRSSIGITGTCGGIVVVFTFLSENGAAVGTTSMIDAMS